jgi:putative FmdB family regulatory protein
LPTYEYECTACGHEFESFHSIKAPPIKKCPKCGKMKVKRLIGLGAGLLFKGSGFYITDYRNEAYNKSAKADSAPTTDAKPADGAAPAAKTEAKTETKAEPKAEPKSEPKQAAKAPEKKESKRK